jgi:lipid II:glycine glycyltransferase (peptidoglycan interpeptide bridge formation enzyme)
MTVTTETPAPVAVDLHPARAPLELRRAGRDEWIALAAGFADHNYRHCWDYAERLAARAGAAAEHVVVERDGHPVGLASVRVKRIPGAGTGIAYVSGGPLVRRSAHDVPAERLEAALAALRREYVDRRRLVLRVAPAIGEERWNAGQDACLRATGFRPGAHLRPYRTMMVDLDRPLADVRNGLAKKWRNLLRGAERLGLEVAHGTQPELFDAFAPLFDELVARKAFAVDLGADFYAALQRELPEHERLHVAIASLDGEPAAGVVASIHGDTAVYLLGASNDLGRRTNAAYLLQWEVIEAAAARGCRWYDLGGIDPVANPGVHRFKERMGGADVVAPGPYELAPGRVRGAAVHAAERAFRLAAARRSGGR